jgi:hypothetical protein
MPHKFTTGPDEEQQVITPIYSPLSPPSPRKPAASHDSLHDYLEGRRPYRRTQTCCKTVKRWLIGPPVLLICLALVVGLAWVVFTRVYQH